MAKHSEHLSKEAKSRVMKAHKSKGSHGKDFDMKKMMMKEHIK